MSLDPHITRRFWRAVFGLPVAVVLLIVWWALVQ